MANEITEKDCLEAELLLGYKYYQSEAALAEQCKEKETALRSAKGELTAVTAEYPNRRNADLNSNEYFIKRYAEEMSAYQMDYKAATDKKKEGREQAMREAQEKDAAAKAEFYKMKRIIGAVLLVLGLVLVFLTVLMGIKGCEGASTPADASPLASLAVFVGIGAVAAIVFGIITFSQEYKPTNEQTSATFDLMPLNFPTFREWLVNKNGLSYYEKDYPEKSQKLIARENLAQNAVQTATEELYETQAREKELKELGVKLQQKLTVIPPYYFQRDAITKMLFFYVNKRADNVRDLINLYETTVFQEAVLKGLQSISISVDRLTETVRGSFNRLGLQLGVINESIRENTGVQRLNYEKLSAIKDENAKHYIDIVNAIEDVELVSNTSVTTNVTTEIEFNS